MARLFKLANNDAKYVMKSLKNKAKKKVKIFVQYSGSCVLLEFLKTSLNMILFWNWAYFCCCFVLWL